MQTNTPRLGVGHAVPKDIADGTFTRRAPTSNDKLLEQLLGKKRAKAHLAAKQEAVRASARQQPAWQQQQKPVVQKDEESDDDDESRAATLAATGRRGEKPMPVPKSKITESKSVESTKETVTAGVQDAPQQDAHDPSDDDIDLKPKKRAKKSRAKPTSYLDELLAERSKKKTRRDRVDTD